MEKKKKKKKKKQKQNKTKQNNLCGDLFEIKGVGILFIIWWQ
jgi:hypothetical protein